MQDLEQQRWKSEADYFDEQEYSGRPIDPATILRYRVCKKPWLAPEHFFWALGDVTNKRILDVGCGDGRNSILMALKGANVTGVDVSAKAIEFAGKNAQSHGVSGKTHFLCCPIEKFQGESGFDIIIGRAILHHLIAGLDNILIALKSLGKPGSLVVFEEPVSMSGLYRRVRLLLPIPVQGTPDERPLNPGDLETVARHFSPCEIHYFDAFARLNRFVAKNGNYEKSPPIRRAICDLLGRTDGLLLNTLHFRKLATCAIILGKIPPQQGA